MWKKLKIGLSGNVKPSKVFHLCNDMAKGAEPVLGSKPQVKAYFWLDLDNWSPVELSIFEYV